MGESKDRYFIRYSFEFEIGNFSLQSIPLIKEKLSIIM